MEPSAEALAWQRRADAWAQQADGDDRQAVEPANRWSDVAATGRPTFPADGVGWRTETAEWRATGARWRQTTEWRSTTGSHGWRSTTEAWQTGGRNSYPPAAETPMSQPAISSTAHESEADRPSWQQFTSPSGSPKEETPSWQQPAQRPPAESSPSWQQLVEPDKPSWQRDAIEGSATWTDVPETRQAPDASAPAWGRGESRAETPSWQTPRDDDRAAWRRDADPTDTSTRVGRRRAPEGGTGWTTRSDTDNWAGHTDTGNIQLYPDPATPAPSWGEGGGRRALPSTPYDDTAPPTGRAGRRRAAEPDDYAAPAEPGPGYGEGRRSRRSRSADPSAGAGSVGYSAPPGGGYSAPPGGGYSAPPGGGYSAPPAAAPSSGYAAPPAAAPSRGYSAAPSGFAAPPGEDGRERGAGAGAGAAGGRRGGRGQRYNRAKSDDWREQTGSWEAEPDTSNWVRDPDTGQWSRSGDDPRVLAWRREAARREAMNKSAQRRELPAGPSAPEADAGGRGVSGAASGGVGPAGSDGFGGARAAGYGSAAPADESRYGGSGYGGAAPAGGTGYGSAAPASGTGFGGTAPASGIPRGGEPRNGVMPYGGGPAPDAPASGFGRAPGSSPRSGPAYGSAEDPYAAEQPSAFGSGPSTYGAGSANRYAYDDEPRAARGYGDPAARPFDDGVGGGPAAAPRSGPAYGSARPYGEPAADSPRGYASDPASAPRSGPAYGATPASAPRSGPAYGTDPASAPRSGPAYGTDPATRGGSAYGFEATSAPRSGPAYGVDPAPRRGSAYGADQTSRDGSPYGTGPAPRDAYGSDPTSRDAYGSDPTSRDGSPYGAAPAPRGGSPYGTDPASSPRSGPAYGSARPAYGTDPSSAPRSGPAYGTDPSAPPWSGSAYNADPRGYADPSGTRPPYGSAPLDGSSRNGRALPAGPSAYADDPASSPRSGAAYGTAALPAAPRSGVPRYAEDDDYRPGRRRADDHDDEPPTGGGRRRAADPDSGLDPDTWRADAETRSRRQARRLGMPMDEPLDEPENRQRLEPGSWVRDEREEAARGTYRGANGADWRRELAEQSDLAEGESKRYGTSDFIPFRSGGSAAVPRSSNLSMTSTSLISPVPREQGDPMVRRDPLGDPMVRPQRASNGYQAPSGSYERRPVTGSFPTVSRRSDLLDPDDEEDEQESGGPLAAVGYTVIWYGVPIVLFVLYMLVINTGARTHALDTLSRAAPQFGISLLLSIVVAIGLRYVSHSWKAISVGLAAAVVGGGLATVLSSAITGNSLS